MCDSMDKDEIIKRIKEENKKIRIPVIKFEDFIYNLIEGVDPIA